MFRWEPAVRETSYGNYREKSWSTGLYLYLDELHITLMYLLYVVVVHNKFADKCIAFDFTSYPQPLEHVNLTRSMHTIICMLQCVITYDSP